MLGLLLILTFDLIVIVSTSPPNIHVGSKGSKRSPQKQRLTNGDFCSSGEPVQARSLGEPLSKTRGERGKRVCLKEREREPERKKETADYPSLPPIGKAIDRYDEPR